MNIRETLESWYSRFPDPTGDLRSRLRAKDQNSLSAYFEFFLHELFLKIGLEVQAGPLLPTGTRPDFLITGSAGESAYVEATVVLGDRDNPHEQAVLDAINELDGEVPNDIGVAVSTRGTLDRTPKLTAIKGKVRGWLNEVSATELDAKPIAAAPRMEVAAGDWNLTL